jgi:hypothetical protein
LCRNILWSQTTRNPEKMSLRTFTALCSWGSCLGNAALYWQTLQICQIQAMEHANFIFCACNFWRGLMPPFPRDVSPGAMTYQLLSSEWRHESMRLSSQAYITVQIQDEASRPIWYTVTDDIKTANLLEIPNQDKYEVDKRPQSSVTVGVTHYTLTYPHKIRKYHGLIEHCFSSTGHAAV